MYPHEILNDAPYLELHSWMSLMGLGVPETLSGISAVRDGFANRSLKWDTISGRVPNTA